LENLNFSTAQRKDNEGRHVQGEPQLETRKD